MIPLINKFEIIDSMKDKYSIKLLCKVANASRSGYYAWKHRKQIDKHKELKEKILNVYNKSKQVYGYRRIKVALKKEYGLIINHKKIKRLMKQLNIKSKIRRRKFRYPIYKKIDRSNIEPNILNRNFTTTNINQKWVTDITYLYYGKNRNKAYLSALMDLHNNEIISYKLSTNLGLEFVIDTITEAFSREKGRDLSKLIIHSDQGFHYTSILYKKLLRDNNVTQSMSRKGNCYDNACIENFFGHLKSELIHLSFFETKENLFRAVDEYIYWYNNHRFQSVLKNHTPIEYRCVA